MYILVACMYELSFNFLCKTDSLYLKIMVPKKKSRIYSSFHTWNFLNAPYVYTYGVCVCVLSVSYIIDISIKNGNIHVMIVKNHINLFELYGMTIIYIYEC